MHNLKKKKKKKNKKKNLKFFFFFFYLFIYLILLKEIYENIITIILKTVLMYIPNFNYNNFNKR